ncbi:MAG: prolipoprotein diacylglyceryl transferase [Cellulophaga sp.]
MEDGIIYWNVDPTIFWITNSFSIRYYGLCWVLALALGYYIVKRIYINEKTPLEELETLTLYIILGTFLGARLGHCFFYEPAYYFENITEVLLPIKKVGASYKFYGFRGLASHGAVLGVFIAIAIYAKKNKIQILWLLDRVAIGSTVTAAFIRIGNLMNSEIYGKPTNGNWGVVFERNDLIPRHPTQIYEAVSYLLIFGVLMFIYNRKNYDRKNGILFILLFSARFIIEFFKENQMGFEDSLALNMGQILSIPIIITGVVFLFAKRSI